MKPKVFENGTSVTITTYLEENVNVCKNVHNNPLKKHGRAHSLMM
jgi:hypothetical protein